MEPQGSSTHAPRRKASSIDLGWPAIPQWRIIPSAFRRGVPGRGRLAILDCRLEPHGPMAAADGGPKMGDIHRDLPKMGDIHRDLTRTTLGVLLIVALIAASFWILR